MNKAIIGRKVGMTQIFAEDGKMIPVTVVEAGPCPVVQVKTVERDGYSAVKVGFDKIRENLLTKPELGQFKKAGVEPCRHLKEFRLNSVAEYEVGKAITVEVFNDGDKVTLATLIEAGIVRKELDGLKVLGNGEITKKVTVKAAVFSATAKEKIEAVGGKAEVL